MKDNEYSVYMHKNKTNDKVYIGITSQIPQRRWRNGTNYYGNQYFNRAIKKYGWHEGFEHIIIKDNLSKSEAEDLEVKLIKEYKSTDRKHGYNIEKGGSSSGKHSKETIKKISESQKGVKNHMYGKTGLQSVVSKKVVCISNNQIFESLNEAHKYFKIKSEKISKSCKNKGVYNKEGNLNNLLAFMWYSDYIKLSEIEISKIIENNLSEINKVKLIKRHNNGFHKNIFCLNDGIFYEKCKDACEVYGISNSAISMNINKETYYCKSKITNETYVFCVAQEYQKLNKQQINDMIEYGKNKSSRKNEFSSRAKKVICLDDGNIFDSAKLCSKFYNIDASYICMVCNNKLTQAKGLHFKYI